ncbi:LPS O-antigen chain length determinant protein WzzB [uncultured Photobacterium sp.]|uniref:LPS O-antigen chain length determinant protein WzzB n=1 Tax=uncultured Photobacterium sp. TaxID=173973 RepID=UPI0026030D44|nr:Wzz/FepE/Etk N-terminal domain-containing protein [uncultured Photobacterium sp.]
MTDNLVHNNSYSQPVNPEVKDLRPMFMSEDEIDLKTLFLTLWKSKWQILSCSFMAGLVALIYAFTVPEVWTSSVKVMEPRINDYYQLRTEVNKFAPVFEEKKIARDDETIEETELAALIQPDVLFKQYIDAFNSTINKKAFINNNELYKKFIANKKTSEHDELILEQWLNNVQAIPEQKKRGEPSYYTLSFSSFSQENSYLLLEQYTNYIARLVNKHVIQGVNNTITAYKASLKSTSLLLSQKAINKLELEIKKTDIAIDITTKAAIDKPFLSYANNNLFPINLGLDVNIAKKDVLKKITDLSFFEPELITINGKLKILSDNKKVRSNVEFSVISYIDEISLPLTKDKPKRALIVMLVGLLGMMLGVAFVIVRKAFSY